MLGTWTEQCSAVKCSVPTEHMCIHVHLCIRFSKTVVSDAADRPSCEGICNLIFIAFLQKNWLLLYAYVNRCLVYYYNLFIPSTAIFEQGF